VSFTVPKLTGPWNVTQQIEYIEETNFGVLPQQTTSPAFTPAFLYPGPLQDLKVNYNIEHLDYRLIGSRDIYKALKSGEMYTFDIKYNPIDTTFMGYGVNLPSGPGTIEKSLSMIFAQKINNVVNYRTFTGCRCDKIDIEITKGLLQCTMTFFCKAISAPTITNPVTGATFAPTTTTDPWMDITSGPNPFIVGGTVYPTPRFKLGVTNNLQVVRPNGEVQAMWIEPTHRDITVDFESFVYDSALDSATIAMTQNSATYTMAPGHSLAFTTLVLFQGSSSDTATAKAVKTATWAGNAQSVTMV